MTTRAACDFFLAAAFLWIAPREAALSIVRTSVRCAASIALESPYATASSSRLASVLIVER